MRAVLIGNPVSGRKGGVLTNTATVEDAAAALAGQGLPVAVWLTGAPGEGTSLARRAVSEGYDLVIAAGGDGTVHEVAQPLVGSEATLGVMPLGSVMNLARTLAIGRELNEAARIIAAGRAVRMDVGEARGRYFLEYGGVGLDAALCPLSAQVDSGQWSSFGALVRTVARYRPRRLRINVDGRDLVTPAMLVVVANTPFYLWSLELNPEAKIDDRQFSIRVFSQFSLLELGRYIIQIARGLRPYHPKVQRLQGRTISITSAGRAMAAHADTHLIGATPVTFRLIPNALRILANPVVWTTPGSSVVTTEPVAPAGR